MGARRKAIDTERVRECERERARERKRTRSDPNRNRRRSKGEGGQNGDCKMGKWDPMGMGNDPYRTCFGGPSQTRLGSARGLPSPLTRFLRQAGIAWRCFGLAQTDIRVEREIHPMDGKQNTSTSTTTTITTHAHAHAARCTREMSAMERESHGGAAASSL